MADVRYNNADGGTDGVTVTTSNSGGVSGTAFDIVSGTAKFSTTNPRGACGYKVAASESPVLEWTGFTGNDLYSRSYLYIPTLPAAGTIYVVMFRSAAEANIGYVDFTSAKHLVAYAGGQTTVGTYSIAAATWYRVESHIHLDSSAGYIESWLYGVDGTQLDYVKTSNASVTGAERAVFARMLSVTVDVYHDELAAGDARPATLASRAVSGTTAVPSTSVSAGSNASAGRVSAAASVHAPIVSAGGKATPSSVIGACSVSSSFYLDTEVEIVPSSIGVNAAVNALVVSAEVVASADCVEAISHSFTVDVDSRTKIDASHVASHVECPAPSVVNSATVLASAVRASATISAGAVSASSQAVPSVALCRVSIPHPDSGEKTTVIVARLSILARVGFNFYGRATSIEAPPEEALCVASVGKGATTTAYAIEGEVSHGE